MSAFPPKADGTIIARFAKNGTETIIVRRGTFNGHDFIDARVFVDGKDGESVPTKKGLAVPPAKVPDLIAALQKAIE